MRWHYNIPDFLMMLKLDIFREANIKNLGKVRLYGKDFSFFEEELTKNPRTTCEQISPGIHLSKLYQVSKERTTEKIFIMSLSVSSNIMKEKSKTLFLKITTQASISKIRRMLCDR